MDTLTPETKVTTTIQNWLFVIIFIGGVFYSLSNVFTVTDNVERLESRIEKMSDDITELKVATGKMQESIGYLEKRLDVNNPVTEQ